MNLYSRHNSVATLQVYNKLIVDILRQVTNLSPENQDKFVKLMYRTKPKREEFGYYYNQQALSALSYAITHHKVNSIIDLGCGIPLIGVALTTLYSKLRFVGIENEKLLSSIIPNGMSYVHTIHDDLRNLSEKMIKNYDLIYTYEPFADPRLQREYTRKLIDFMRPNQLLLYMTAGASIGTLREALEKKELMRVQSKGCFHNLYRRTLKILKPTGS